MRTPYPLWGYKWREKGKEAPSAIPPKIPDVATFFAYQSAPRVIVGQTVMRDPSGACFPFYQPFLRCPFYEAGAHDIPQG